MLYEKVEIGNETKIGASTEINQNTKKIKKLKIIKGVESTCATDKYGYRGCPAFIRQKFLKHAAALRPSWLRWQGV